MNWIVLFLAGAFEVVWTVGLKSGAFTRLTPSLVTLGAMSASFSLLSYAMRSLPLGTAYAVWVGIGAVGAAIAGVVMFKEPMSLLKLVSLGFVVVGIIGLKLAAGAR